MTYLLALLSTGKGSWLQVMELINSKQFEKTILVTNQFGKERFTLSKNIELVVVDFRQDIHALVHELITKLQGKIPDTEVALNFSSGSGKEHMAVLSALLKLGLGIRLVERTDSGVVEV